MKDFYSRTSCEVQPILSLFMDANPAISTHAPLARCNTSPVHNGNAPVISTHAPLARCNENLGIKNIHFSGNFYSHTSCEVQPYLYDNFEVYLQFLLTHLLRGATHGLSQYCWVIWYFYSRTSCEVQQLLVLARFYDIIISTHAPLARCNK